MSQGRDVTMTQRLQGCGLALACGLISSAYAAPPQQLVAIVKRPDCGSFIMKATIAMTKEGDTYADVEYQTIRLLNDIDGFSANLDLGQHTSRSYRGRPGHWLDAIATEATCVRSRLGKNYLLIDFACWNPAARTCSTAMDHAGSEWDQIYDAHAKPLTAGQFDTMRTKSGSTFWGLGLSSGKGPRRSCCGSANRRIYNNAKSSRCINSSRPRQPSRASISSERCPASRRASAAS